MATKDRKTALITGASSGIGRELAKIHAKCGDDVILVARRKERLEALKNSLQQEYVDLNVHIIIQDLSLPKAATLLYEIVKERGLEVDYLINSAGFGGHGYFHERSWEIDESMIQLNVMTLVHLTRLFGDDMVKRQSGKILNVSSTAGFAPGPLHSVYYATKAFVTSFSEALSNELEDKNVSVTVLCPGPTKTEFYDVANTKETRAFKRKMASVADVAAQGHTGMMQGKSLVVPGVLNKFILFSMRFIPRFITTKISRMMMEKP
jgi:uncharacterized protein